MEMYTTETANTACWPALIESGYQLLGGGEASTLAPKLPHLGLADVLFLTSIMSIPRERRPWGIVTWMAEAFMLSRPALYNLSERVVERLLPSPVAGYPSTGSGHRLLEQSRAEKEAESKRNRLARTVLTAAFPGKMALRPMQQLLSEALDESRSIGWLSEVLSEAGQQAGEVLRKIDASPLGVVIGARDETFFNNVPILMLVDPVTSTILQIVAAPDRQADTWGITLLTAQDRGVILGGLIEDMARTYPKSLDEAGLEIDVQKDTWHVEEDGAQLQTDLERAALNATRQVMALEEKLRKEWDDQLFVQKYIPAVVKEAQLYDQHAAFSSAYAHLCDALEVVDWRSGEIRDPQTSAWFLADVLTLLEQIDHNRVQSWVRTLRRHQKELLTCLDWLAASLLPYEQEVAQTLPNPALRTQFMRGVARLWRLRQALINGHNHLRTLAQCDQDALTLAIGGCPILTKLAERLHQILDAACRASSMIENINGSLKGFLRNRRSFPNLETLHLYLNLFALWHNMRVYQRGKRQGKSPYQWAGIQTAHDDWLAPLGYPAV